MKTFSGQVRQDTQGNNQILDITDALQALVRQSSIQTGQLAAMVVGSTAALTTLEYEPGLVNHDVAAAMERIAPETASYRHEATWHDDNGHSHIRAAITGSSLCLPVVQGKIPLGTWQQIVLIDFDTRPRRREVVVTIVGE